MATGKLSEKDLAEISEVAEQWGKIIVRKAFGEQGPGLDVNLSMMEEAAVAAARGLTKGTLEAATAQQADAMATTQPCPQCGQLGAVKATKEARPVWVRGGQFDHGEPVCYCTRCRRDFFPAALGAPTGHARL